MMKTLVPVLAALLTASCAAPAIPDDIPPAPPERRGEPYAAPSLEQNGPAEDGFGGDGFGGETPTVEPTTSAPADAPADGKPVKKGDKTDGKDGKADKPAKPATDGSGEEPPPAESPQPAP